MLPTLVRVISFEKANLSAKGLAVLFAAVCVILVVSAGDARAYNLGSGPAPTVTGVPAGFNGMSFRPGFSTTTNSLHHVDFFCAVNDGPIFDCDGTSTPVCTAATTPGQHTCSSSYHQSRLPEGTHKFAFYAGQCDEVSRVDCDAESDWFLGIPHVASVVFDYTAPVATILNPNAAPTKRKPMLKRSRPVFEFSSNEAASFECFLGSTSLGVCTSPYKLMYPLKNKTYEFRVRARDVAGNFSPRAVKVFSVDVFQPKNCARRSSAAKKKCKKQNSAAKKRWKRKHGLR